MMKLKRRLFVKPKSRIAFYFLLFIGVLGLLAPIIANDLPLLAYNEQGELVMPFINGQFDEKEDQSIINPLIPYSESNIDLSNANAVGPFEKQNVSSRYYRHWLGTDELGRDVLAQLIYGCSTAMYTAIFSMLLAALIGLFIGGISAYFGDRKLRLPLLSFIVFGVYAIVFAIGISVVVPWEINSLKLSSKLFVLIKLVAVMALIALVLHIILKSLNKHLKLRKYSIPLDLYLGRFIEVVESLPLFFLIIAIAALFEPSLWGLILIIAFSSWPKIAKYFRAEVFLTKNMNYIKGGEALGFNDFRLLFKHILPNALSPVLVVISFGAAAAILTEATLSFLGFGLNATQASWGQLLAAASSDYKAWWLAILPGMAIFLSVMSFNILGDALSSEKRSE